MANRWVQRVQSTVALHHLHHFFHRIQVVVKLFYGYFILRKGDKDVINEALVQ